MVEDELVRRIESAGGICEKTVALGKRGFPDRTCFLPGAVVAFVEVKRPRGGVKSEHQVKYHARLALLGIEVAVVRDSGDIDRLLERLKKKATARMNAVASKSLTRSKVTPDMKSSEAVHVK